MPRKLGLLNYTTEISPEKSAQEILIILAHHRARKILTEFDKDGFISGISFIADTPQGEVVFRMPIDVGAILKVLERQKREGKIRITVNEDRARKVAWRIMKDWVESQMAIIETEMVKLEQVFLPYAVVRDGQTLFEVIRETKFQLPRGKEGEFKEVPDGSR